MTFNETQPFNFRAHLLAIEEKGYSLAQIAIRTGIPKNELILIKNGHTVPLTLANKFIKFAESLSENKSDISQPAIEPNSFQPLQDDQAYKITGRIKDFLELTDISPKEFARAAGINLGSLTRALSHDSSFKFPNARKLHDAMNRKKPGFCPPLSELLVPSAALSFPAVKINSKLDEFFTKYDVTLDKFADEAGIPWDVFEPIIYGGPASLEIKDKILQIIEKLSITENLYNPSVALPELLEELKQPNNLSELAVPDTIDRHDVVGPAKSSEFTTPIESPDINVPDHLQQAVKAESEFLNQDISEPTNLEGEANNTLNNTDYPDLLYDTNEELATSQPSAASPRLCIVSDELGIFFLDYNVSPVQIAAQSGFSEDFIGELCRGEKTTYENRRLVLQVLEDFKRPDNFRIIDNSQLPRTEFAGQSTVPAYNGVGLAMTATSTKLSKAAPNEKISKSDNSEAEYGVKLYKMMEHVKNFLEMTDVPLAQLAKVVKVAPSRFSNMISRGELFRYDRANQLREAMNNAMPDFCPPLSDLVVPSLALRVNSELQDFFQKYDVSNYKFNKEAHIMYISLREMLDGKPVGPKLRKKILQTIKKLSIPENLQQQEIFVHLELKDFFEKYNVSINRLVIELKIHSESLKKIIEGKSVNLELGNRILQVMEKLSIPENLRQQEIFVHLELKDFFEKYDVSRYRFATEAKINSKNFKKIIDGAPANTEYADRILQTIAKFSVSQNLFTSINLELKDFYKKYNVSPTKLSLEAKIRHNDLKEITDGKRVRPKFRDRILQAIERLSTPENLRNPNSETPVALPIDQATPKFTIDKALSGFQSNYNVPDAKIAAQAGLPETSIAELSLGAKITAENHSRIPQALEKLKQTGTLHEPDDLIFNPHLNQDKPPMISPFKIRTSSRVIGNDEASQPNGPASLVLKTDDEPTVPSSLVDKEKSVETKIPSSEATRSPSRQKDEVKDAYQKDDQFDLRLCLHSFMFQIYPGHSEQSIENVAEKSGLEPSKILGIFEGDLVDGKTATHLLSVFRKVHENFAPPLSDLKGFKMDKVLRNFNLKHIVAFDQLADVAGISQKLLEKIIAGQSVNSLMKDRISTAMDKLITPENFCHPNVELPKPLLPTAKDNGYSKMDVAGQPRSTESFIAAHSPDLSNQSARDCVYPDGDRYFSVVKLPPKSLSSDCLIKASLSGSQAPDVDNKSALNSRRATQVTARQIGDVLKIEIKNDRSCCIKLEIS